MGPLKLALGAGASAVSILLFAFPILLDRLSNIRSTVEMDIQEVRSLESKAWQMLMERRQLRGFKRQKRQVNGYCVCNPDNNCPRGVAGLRGEPGLIFLLIFSNILF